MPPCILHTFRSVYPPHGQLASNEWYNGTTHILPSFQYPCYSLHQKKVYTCGSAKYSKLRGARGKVGDGGYGAPPIFLMTPLSFEYSARQKCILSFGGDCINHIKIQAEDCSHAHVVTLIWVHVSCMWYLDMTFIQRLPVTPALLSVWHYQTYAGSYTLIRKSYNNVHPPGTISFLHFLARTERNYIIWILCDIKLEEESRNKTIHSALFSLRNPFDGNSSHPFNDFFSRV